MDPLELGPIDMSINKAVVYLWVGALATILFRIWVAYASASPFPADATPDDRRGALRPHPRARLPRAAAGEGDRPLVPVRRPLFLFIWVLNIVGFIPLPISSETFNVLGADLPTWGIYAATANLGVTLALAFITFGATHVGGVRYMGTPAGTGPPGAGPDRRPLGRRPR